MASPKSEKFGKSDIKLAKFTRAMAHPARIAILRHLASKESCCFNEISKEIPLADSTVSQHLSGLKNAGLIEDFSDPPRIRYSLNRENWKQARKLLKDLTREMQ